MQTGEKVSVHETKEVNSHILDYFSTWRRPGPKWKLVLDSDSVEAGPGATVGCGMSRLKPLLNPRAADQETQGVEMWLYTKRRKAEAIPLAVMPSGNRNSPCPRQTGRCVISKL